MRFLIFIVKAALTLVFTGALLYGAFFGFLMALCTAGGALIIIIPIAMVVFPFYIKIMRALWVKKGVSETDDESKTSEEEISEEIMKERAPSDVGQKALVQYIVKARAVGDGDEKIIRDFLDAGWTDTDINNALNFVNAWNSERMG